APRTVLKGTTFDVLSVEGATAGAFDTVRSELFTYAQSTAGGTLSVGPATAEFDQARFGLSAQQRTLGGYLEGIFEASDATYGRTFGVLDAAVAADDSSFGRFLTELSPGASLAASAANIELSQSRFDALLGCGQTPWERASGTATGQGCVIAESSGRSLEQDSGSGAVGYDAALFTTTVGFQAPVAPDTTAGFAIGYEHSRFDGDLTSADTDGDTFTVGASATRRYGDFAVSLAASGSFGWHDLERKVSLPDGTRTALADYTSWSLGLRARAAYGFDVGQVMVTPALDLDFVYAAAEGYSERGAGERGLTVDDSEETALRATPSLSLARRFDIGEATTLVTWATAGLSVSTADSYGATARFTGAAADAGSFASDVALSQASGRVSAGLELFATEQLNVGLRYDGAFGNGYAGHAGSLRLNWRF
uniref:autotransporter outer membrane beta-barrel domain-containing protein n=1 Tax=Oceanicella sp. SM1341 TaxID=1548889 RepID=UPI0013005762